MGEKIGGLNTTNKFYSNEQVQILGKLTSNNTWNIGILTCASKDIFTNVLEQFLQILTNNDRLKGLKGSTKLEIDNTNVHMTPFSTIFKLMMILITE